MSVKRVTPEEIEDFYRLYRELGNYAAVARKTGRSASTVARYIKLKGIPKVAAHTFHEKMREGG